MTRRILVIDDEASTLMITKTSLEVTTSWHIKAVESVLDGLKIAEQEQPDAILLDVIMFELDGVAAFHRLQSNVRTQDIPVIFLTVKAGHRERRSLETVGAAGVITKPFEPDLLAKQISTLLNWH